MLYYSFFSANSMNQSRLEECLNSISHYAGALISLAGLVFLLIKAIRFGTIEHIISFSLFGIALILLYSISGTYHILHTGPTKDIFRILDHSSIYILIAASYTPYLLTIIKGDMGIVLLCIQWSIVFAGILFKIRYTGKYDTLSTILYLVMGWMIVLVFKNLKMNLDPLSLKFLIISGVTYSIGTIFYLLDRFPYIHSIWHIFVMGGSFFNYLSVYYSI